MGGLRMRNRREQEPRGRAGKLASVFAVCVMLATGGCAYTYDPANHKDGGGMIKRCRPGLHDHGDPPADADRRTSGGGVQVTRSSAVAAKQDRRLPLQQDRVRKREQS